MTAELSMARGQILPPPYHEPNYHRLKCDLLASGVRSADLPDTVKRPHRIRSGACGGLDIIFPDGTQVNAPVNETFALTSPYWLDATAGRTLLRMDGADHTVDVRLAVEPAYYRRELAPELTPLRLVGQICSDRLGIGLTNRCVIWNSKSDRCRFCSIGLNVRTGDESRDKGLEDIVAVVEAAVSDSILPARHVLLGGGTPNLEDAGAEAVAAAATAIRERHPNISIYAMIAPPDDISWIDRLKDSGINELGMNIELFSIEAAERFTPGKAKRLGRDRYLRALSHSVEVFGPINTRSIVMVGLEPAAETIAGAKMLAEMGVMPILSPFRPLKGTDLEHHPRLSGDELWDLALAAADAVAPSGIPLGPTCIPCQANTLTAGQHDLYRYY